MGKDKDIKNRIKKVVPENQWLMNVTKSLGFASMDVIKDLIPNTYSTVDWNKDTIISAADMVKDLRDNNGIRNSFSKQFKNIPHVKIANNAINNALADIKSGNLYNQNRSLGLDENGEFSFDDFSFDDDSGPMFIDDDGSGGEEDSSSDGNSRPPVTIINTMPLAKTIASSTEATVNTMVGIAEQQMAVETEKLMLDKHTFSATLNALDSINQNLSLMVQFNADSTAKYQAAALKYFEESLNALKKPEEEEKKKNIKKIINPFTAEGGLKLDEYGEIIRKNLEGIKDENMLISAAYDFLKDPTFFEELAKNPLGFMMSEGIKKLIPKTFKSSLGKLDKNLNSIMPALLARINTFEDSDDSLLKMLNKVFGSNEKANYEVDLGDYKKGAIEWDGESKKALVEVIPSYLRRIESILGGTEERFYNYDTGKFDNIHNIKKHYDDSIAKAEVSGFYNVKSEANDIVSRLGLSSDARKQFDKDLEEYFRAMTKKGYLIKHEDQTRDGRTYNEMTEAGLFDFDPNRTKLIQKVLSMLPKSVLTEMGTSAITDSVIKIQKHMDDVRDNPALSGYSYLHNDLDENGVARYNKSKLSMPSEKDRYGLNHLDYLRDIRSALINGIKVFPDHRRRFTNGVPNASILGREQAEETEYQNRVREEEEAKRREEERARENANLYNRGRSINDAANIRESEWNRIFPNERPIDPDAITEHVDTLNDKVEDMLYEILYGQYDYREKAADKLKALYGKSKPIVLSMRGFFKDTVNAFKSFFTGQGYVTSDGVTVEPTESLMGSIKTSLFGIKDKFVDSTKPGGIFYKFFDDFMDGFDTFKTSLFGEKKLNDGKETFQDLMGKVKQRLPKALAYGYGGAVIKTMFASNLGLLGNFLLPGGPIGAMLTGTTLGFLKQSETFNRYVFGEQDEEGNRTGGLISKAWQDKYQEYKGVIGKGAGLGILASLFLPGGPVAGAILGIGTGIASRNEAFQEFLYGKDYKEQDKKSIMNGAFGKALKKLSGGGETDDPKLAKFLGATGLGVGIAQGVGLLPSFLLPGGPIMGAMLGLAGGIAASSNKFQEFLLGEKDIDGQRHGGLLTKAANWFSLTFAQPLKLKFTEFNDFLYGMLRKNIFDPITRSFEPIVHGVKNVFINAKDSLVEAFTNITHPIVKAFKENIIDPISTVVKKAILNPIKWILKKTFGLMTKTLVGIITSPISIAGRVADKYNEYSAVRQEKFRRRREYDKNTAKEDRNYYDRKAAGKLTKEEKKEAIAKGVSYRKGKTWGEKKKEQKDAYKEEMAKRKDRRKQMQEQFEEDKKFAKENGFKYRSKKQQEKREQELKEKERWIQEQQLMQAQETDEKVSKIADNVIQFPQQNDKVVNRLDEVKETLKEGFNKLANKMGFGDDGEYGQVTDEHLAPIYDFLDEKQKRRPESVTKEPEDYGQVTDEHLATIHNFIDKENAKEEKPTTLKDAFDGFKSEVKDLVKTIKDTRDNKNTAPGLPDPNRDRKYITKNENKDMVDSDSITIDPEKLHDPDLQEKVAKLNKKFKQRKSNVIDFNKFLEDNDRSHKDGLDLVPNDGYIAELHEGEMVVPEKPAGKLRGLMDKAGKGFKGLTNILSETSEDDIDHRDEEPGMVEESLLHGTIKGLRGMAGLMGGMASFMGNIGSFFNRGMSKEEERDREDNALGVTDDEADRLKEMEDKARYEHASRKNVDYVQEKIAAKDKEKEDKQWKASLLDAIRNVGHSAAASSLDLFSLLGKGFDMLKNGLGNIFSGLGSLTLPALIGAGVYSWNKYKNSEEYIESRTDVDNDGDGEGDFIYDNTDVNIARGYISAREKLIYKPIRTIKKKFVDPVVEGTTKAYKGVKNTGKKFYDSKVGQKFIKPIKEKYTAKMNKVKGFVFGEKSTPSNVVDFAQSKAAKNATQAGSGKVVNKAMQGSSDNVVDFAQKKAAKEAAQAGAGKTVKEATQVGSGKAVKKFVGETVDDVAGNRGLFNKMIDMAKTAIQTIGKKLSEKFPSIMGKMTKLSDELLEIVIRQSDGIIKKFAKKIATWMGKVVAGTSTGFVLDAVFGACDLVSGATAGNAGNLFGVSPQNVDLKMRIISSVLQVVTNFNVLGVIGLINEITSAMFNINFIRKLAIGIYNLISDDDADLRMRISAKEIDNCKSIDEALAIMGIKDPNDIARLKDGNEWKNFTECENEEFGGVISSTEQMELARLQYNLANGTKLSSQAYVDKESKTLGSKLWEGTKKVFTTETAQQKINKLNNKAQKDRDKAAEHRKKAEESNNIFSKGWNKSMAWLNEKQADHREKKAKKKEEKANKKKAKAESKVAYHEEKAANSTGISKWYHGWRAKRNQKKVEKYTLDNGKVVSEGSTSVTTDTTTTTTEDPKVVEAKKHILTPEQVLANSSIPVGGIVYDAYENAYDHNGNYIGTGIDDAGQGDGEGEVDLNVEYKSSKSGKGKTSLVKKVGKGFLNLMPGGAALASGVSLFSSLFGKNNKPEDYRMVPIMDENGNVVSYQSQPIDNIDNVEGFDQKNLQVKGMDKNTQVIPQLDEKGNVVSFTTQDKNKPKQGLFGKIASGIGSLFGLGSSTTTNTSSSNVDNSSSVTNNTGDTYNTTTTTNEIDTTPFGPLTDAINSLVDYNPYNNVDEEGNVKNEGGILKAIMDPFGYLSKKLIGFGVNLYEDKTGKDVNDEDLNNSITFLNILRNPFGYLANKLRNKIAPGDRTCEKCGKPVNECTCEEDLKKWGKEKLDQGKEWVEDKYNTAKDWTVDKYNKGKDWTIDKYNKGKDWVEDKYNTAKDWTIDKYNKGKDWVEDKYNTFKTWNEKQKTKSDDFADIMMGDNSAEGNILTRALSGAGDIGTVIWNKLAPEGAKLEEGQLADFMATMINRMIVKPFQELTDPLKEKFSEAKEAVSGWINEKKEAIMGWFNDKIKEPFSEWMDKAKDKVTEMKEGAASWINDKKDKIFDWFNEKIKEPFSKWADKAKDKITDMKEGAVSWINDKKDKISDWYKEKIKEPFKKWMDKAKSKVKEMKEGAASWIGDKKDKISDWYKEKIKEPFSKWANKAKDKINDMKEGAASWISDKKDKIGDLFKEKIKEPFSNWANKAKNKIDDMKEGAKSWISGMKEKIVDLFNKNIKEPIGEALSPVTTAVNGAWTSLKSAFEPISGIFSAIKEGRWGDIASIVKKTGQEGRDNANADADNDGAGTTGPRPSDVIPRRFRPVKHNISPDELVDIDRKPTRRPSGIPAGPDGRPIGPTRRPSGIPAGPDGRPAFGKSLVNDKFVHYTQSDERWGANKLGKKTMKDAGCGPTSLAMAISQMTGEQITPDTIASLGEEHLPGYSKFSLFPSVANKLSMNYSEGTDPRFIMSNLKRGIPVVLSGRTRTQGTPYTPEGHVVTASHLKGNMVFIQDPRGKEYSGYYPLNKLSIGLNKGMIVTPSNRTDVRKLSSGRSFSDLTLDKELYKEDYGINGDVGEYEQLGGIGGKTGAGQITMADRVLSYARAFLNNTSKFSYSQPRRLQIDNNKSSSKGCGADCSSFVSHVLSRAGDVNIYGTTSQTFWDSVGTKVSEPQIGDVVCQQGHVGLYSGDGNYIHMSGRKSGIKESKAIQKGNNKHRGYKRVLKNPSQMVDPTVPNANTFLGTVVGTSSGQPVGGSAGGPQASLDKALLIGDSLTVGMKDVLEGKYPNAKAMGKGGKWAKHWLEDLNSLPSADSVGTVIQWLGINGVHTNESNMKDSQTLLTKLKEKYPGKPIFNMRIFPTTEKYSYGDYTGEWWRKLSQEFNTGMASWAGSNGVTQIDATNGFIQQDGYLDPSKAVDGIHFTTDGYKGVLANIESQLSSYNSSNAGATTGATAAPGYDQLGVFSKLSTVGNAMITALYNGEDFNTVYNSMLNPVSTTPGTTTPTDGTNPDISNISDTAQAVWKFFTGKGYTPAATAGIMGNMEQESGMKPDIIQGNGKGPAAGICQWENYNTKSARWKDMNAHAQSKGKDWTDLQSQLEFIDIELQGKSPGDNYTSTLLKKNYGGYEGFKAITDYKTATEAFEKSFERASKINWNNRYAGAKKYYDMFSNAGTGFTMASQADPTGDAESNPETMNGWAYYRQGDPQWQEDINNKKIGPSGCGMASHAMMLTTMFGKKVTPVTVGKWARSNGLWNNGMDWGMPSKIASKLGLNIVASKTDFNGLPDGAFDEVVQQIKSGYPVILSGKADSSSNMNSPFTGGGHIVLAVGVDGSGNLIINDPRGPHRTKAYTKSGVMNAGIGMRGYWAFDSTSNAKLPDDWVSGDYTGSPGTGGGTTPTDGSTVVATPGYDQLGVFGKLANVGNTMITALYNGKSFAEVQAGNTAAVGTPTDTSTSTTTTPGVSGKGNFPKYALNEQQIKGIANILQHEQPGIEGRMAEASLMANLVDKTGDDKATVDNLIKKATGGWFAKGKTRFNNPGNPEQISIDAARTVLVEGKRTLPRYVDEHDCFSDLTSVSNNGKSFKASDRSQYKPFVTKIKNRYGASGTFHSFPNSKSDPFYYTSEDLRKKWGDDCYSPTGASGDAGQGDGKTYFAKTWKDKSSKPISKPSINVNQNIKPPYNYDYSATRNEKYVKDDYRRVMNEIEGKNKINVSRQRELD